MIKKTATIILGILLFFSCDTSKEKESKRQARENHLIITSSGDTLENGHWQYTNVLNGVSSSGSYLNGFKIKSWSYVSNGDSVDINWTILSDEGIKMNVPNYLKKISNVEPPVLYQGDIEDGDNNTYVVLLKYDLKKLQLSIYDYLDQYNNSLNSDTIEVLRIKTLKKYRFKGIEIFKQEAEVVREKKYLIISYIFVVNDSLYDLTYKNAHGKTGIIEREVFNDILYTMVCDGVDLFNYNNKQYLKEEVVELN